MPSSCRFWERDSISSPPDFPNPALKEKQVCQKLWVAAINAFSFSIKPLEYVRQKVYFNKIHIFHLI